MLRLHEYAYHRPHTLAEALELKERHGEDATFIAGGTDLMPNMKHALITPGHVIALKGIAGLRGIRIEGGSLVIGATETLAAVARDPEVVSRFPSLAVAAGAVAGPQLRNMGTIGGNLCLDTRCTYYNQTYFWRHSLGFCLKKDGDTCHVTKVGRKCVAAHSADTPPVLMTLNAEAEFASTDGTRRVPVADLFVADGIWNSVRRPDEIVTTIRVPLAASRLRAAFRKVRQRNSIDYPLLNMALAADVADDGRVADMKIVVSALGARPRVIAGLDKITTGEPLSDDVIDAIAQRAFQQCHPLTNIIVDPDWRRAMIPVHVRRMLKEVA
jgi:4-hydroxybenzoyl-CoA reductase subunit beta